MKLRLTLAAVAVALAAQAGAAQARDQIRVVGSSTVFPFATTVAENLGRGGQFKTPVVESTGTGGGLKLFCAGVGTAHPDIANASRRIKQSEIDDCAKNGVAQILELKVGFDGIVLSNAKSGPAANFTTEQIFLALAKEIPQDGKLVPNPYTSWNQIDASLPNEPIEVLGPPPTSGTRDAFVELVMESGCKTLAGAKDLGLEGKTCHAIREDGKYVEAGENDNLIVQKLEANPKAFGIFGYSFLEQNMDKLQGASIAGEQPTFENIADGKYPVSRSMFVYAKLAHVGTIPGLQEYLAEFVSEKAGGEEGYLLDKGLIPLPEDVLKGEQDKVAKLTPLAGL
ncbi:PstS family phosphate ABC transporter substrate-binding protein [Zavarzinia sp. CC-PAN008]|uniref:PstS family phosphate ABC transporter substrate-binding protein n=1 Tax=Zavarzinia sp. CC-PAN008 TaxID=3243332 RepID=UPI003F746DFC